jgi:hypothetical protein
MKYSYPGHLKEVVPMLIVVVFTLVFCWGCQKEAPTESNGILKTDVSLSKIFDSSAIPAEKLEKIKKSKKKLDEAFSAANKRFKKLVEEKRDKKDSKKDKLMDIAQQAPMPEITEEEAYAIYSPCASPTNDYVLEAYDVDLGQELGDNSAGSVIIGQILSINEGYLIPEGWSLLDVDCSVLGSAPEASIIPITGLGGVLKQKNLKQISMQAPDIWSTIWKCLGKAIGFGTVGSFLSSLEGKAISEALIVRLAAKEIVKRCSWWGVAFALYEFSDCMYDELV